jgi:hypothetical protein
VCEDAESASRDRVSAKKLLFTRHAISSTVFHSSQKPASGQACNPADPNDLLLEI